MVIFNSYVSLLQGNITGNPFLTRTMINHLGEDSITEHENMRWDRKSNEHGLYNWVGWREIYRKPMIFPAKYRIYRDFLQFFLESQRRTMGR